MFQKVLLAVDGSEHSAKAVPVAADIAKKSNGEVVVFHAREFLLAKGSAYATEGTSEAKHLVDDVVAQVAAAGVKACGRVVTAQEGRAARAILEEAEAEGADTIVMGSRGHGELAGLLLGSVAHKVIQLSHATVVVAR
ncbi:MAG TPA: universal stress protein [Candidatus Dormibacteraeota bacterium]|nr:universal stress protein [Candidatus Dormibacteraeota bacterium]